MASPERRGEDGCEEKAMVQLWVKFQLHSDEGASLVEYAFLLLLIAVVAIVVISQVGDSASEAFSRTDEGFK